MDEYEIIRLLSDVAGLPSRNQVGIGDDVGVVPSRRGRLVLKADMLVARTDVPPGMTWRQAGRKSIAMCVSDFAAKGVVPYTLMVSLGLPRSMSDDDIASLIDGFRDGVTEWDLKLVGGDTNEACDVVVDCSVAGFASRIVERSTASRGELVVATGEFGVTSAGLKILLDGARSDPYFREVALRSVFVPQPRLDFGLALSSLLTSSMDSSDGLAICLHTISQMSGVGMRIKSIPHPRALPEFAETNGLPIDDLLLYGGEEYEIVGTIKRDSIREAQKIADRKGQRLSVIGETISGSEVTMADGRPIERRGWVHLSS